MSKERRLFTSRCMLVTLFLATLFLVFHGYQNFDETILPALLTKLPSIRTNNAEDLPKIDNYISLWEMKNNLKNYWMLFRDIVKQNNNLNQTKMVDDGFITLNSEFMKIMQMSDNDRKHKLEQISLFIQKKITERQHPDDCHTAKILLCDVRNCCGFGSNLNTLINCLLQAFVSGRTLVYRSKGWKYAEKGWSYAFQPLGNCTDERELNSVPSIAEDVNNTRVVSLISTKQPAWILWSIPSQLENELKKLHGNPYAWWVSQFTKYVLRPQPWLKNKLNKTMGAINFTSSVVGMHIRRGDKIRREAVSHNVSEYMDFVELWYKQNEYQGHQVNRTVYLATDAPEVLTELTLNYPNYKFIGLHTITSEVQKKTQRITEQLENVYFDIHFLSQCDYIVCTLSSNVGRITYHLMMNTHADASIRLQSLDTDFHFVHIGVMTPMVAIMNHDPATKDELQLQKGDEILVRLNSHVVTNNGFTQGRNQRTKKIGKFPTFKARKRLFSYNVSDLQSFGYD